MLGLFDMDPLMTQVRTPRRYDLDWLRVILFGILVSFHALIGFTNKGTYLYGYRNQDTAGVGGELIILLLKI